MNRTFTRSLISSAVMFAMVVNPVVHADSPAPASRELHQSNQNTHRAFGASSPSIEIERAQHASATALKEASNGTTVIDIAAPSAAGVSHNRYTRFDVDQAGVILNNSLNPVLTQLGGWTDGNRRLAGGEASIILNEVTGLSRSQLQGFVEVAGKGAEFILANPNGISCNGCGFINTPRVTLVTGKPDIVGGSVSGFSVTGGDFILEGAGLNASNVDRFDIITRAAQLNAELHARELNIITGRNFVNYATGEITADELIGDAPAFQFALDASSLGAMYANAIQLVGTEKGLGVNSEGLIQSVKQLEIDANGEVRLKTVLANESASIRSHDGDVEIVEKLYSAKVDIQAEGNIVNRGLLAAAEKISLTATHVSQHGELYAGLNSDSTLNTDGRLDVTLEDVFENRGTTYAGDVFDLHARVLDNTDGEISFGSSAVFELDGDLINRNGSIHFRGENGSITANHIDNASGTLNLTGAGSLSLTSHTSVDNTDGVISAKNTISLLSTHLNNLDGAIVAETIDISVDSLDNQRGTVDAGQLDISASSLSNSEGKLISRSTDTQSMVLEIDEHLNNTDGLIYTSGNELSIRTNVFSNQAGVLHTAENASLTIDASQTIDNRDGGIKAASVSLSAHTINNTDGTVTSADLKVDVNTIINDRGNLQGETVSLSADKYTSRGGVLLAFGSTGNVLDLRVSHLIENTLGGIIQANSGNLTLRSDDLDNKGGVINLKGQGVLALNGRINNNDGFIGSAQSLVITGSYLNNAAGELTAKQIEIDAGDLENNSGLIYADAIKVGVNTLKNNAGKLIAEKSLVLNLKNLDNRSGLLHTGGSNFTLSADRINNTKGTLSHSGAGNFSLSALLLENIQGKVTSAGSLEVDTQRLINTVGIINAINNVTVDADEFDNTQGALVSAGGVRVSATSVDNHLGSIQGKNLALASEILNNHSGILLARGGELSIALSDALDNRNGTISGDGLVRIDALGVINDNGEISADQLELDVTTLSNRSGLVQGNALSLTVPDLINTDGTIAALSTSGQGLTLNVAGTLENSGGVLLNKGQQLSIDAENLISYGGEILNLGAGALILRANAINNDHGLIQSNTTLSMTASGVGGIENNAGVISAVDELDVSSVSRLNNTKGKLLAGNSLILTGGYVLNHDGLISASTVSVSADSIDNLGDGVIEAEALAIHAETLTNSGTLLSTGKTGHSLQFDVTNFINAGTLESHGEDLLLGNVTLQSTSGKIIHHGEGVLRVEANGNFDNRDGVLATRGTLIFNADSVDNRSGELIAGKQLNVTLNAINNQRGLIQSGDGLALNLAHLDNSNDGKILIGGSSAARLNIQNHFNNRDGSVIYQGDNTLQLSAQTFDNTRGVLGGSGDLNIAIADTFDNTDGQIVGEGLISIVALELLNTGKGYLEADRLTLSIDSVINENVIFASGAVGESLQITAGEIINRGLIESHGEDLYLNNAGLNNTEGKLVHRGAGNLVVNQQTLLNNNGLIASLGDVSFTVEQLFNAAGEILATGELALVGGLLDNQGGAIQSDRFTINVRELKNTEQAELIALGDGASSIAAEKLVNNDSDIQVKTTLTINADEVEQDGGRIEAETVNLFAGELDNSGIINAAQLTLDIDVLTNRVGGQLTGSEVLISTGVLDNTGLILAYGVSKQGLEIVSREILNNDRGVIESHGENLSIVAEQTLANLGEIYHQGQGVLRIDSASLDNSNGTIAGGNLLLNAVDLQNSKGQIYAEKTLIVNTSQFDNREGVVQSDGSLSITADTFDNRDDGVLFVKGHAELTLATLDNQGGTITGANFNLQVTELLNGLGSILVDRLHIEGSRLDNTQGVIASNDTGDGGLVIDVIDDLVNDKGLIQVAGHGASIRAGLLDNTDGEIFQLGDGQFSVSATDLINTRGTFYSEHDLTLNIVDTVTNHDGDIFAKNRLNIAAGDIINKGGSLTAGDSLVLSADRLINAESDIETEKAGLISADTLELTVNTLHNLEGGRVQGNSITLSGDELINQHIIASYGQSDNGSGLSFDRILNTGHLESASENWQIGARLLDNNNGVILHTGSDNLLLLIDELINSDQGLIDAGNRFTLQARQVDNVNGFIIARGQGNSQINAEQLDNIGGYIQANNLAITGTRLNNLDGGEIGATSLTLTLDRIDNHDSSLVAETLSITTEQLSNSQSEDKKAYILATDLSITANALNNSAAIQAEQLLLSGNTLHNSGGKIIATGDSGNSLSLNFSESIKNLGFIESWGTDFDIKGSVDNRSGTLILHGNGVLSLSNLEANAGGKVISRGDIQILSDVDDTVINNADGLLQAANNIVLDASGIINSTSGAIDTAKGEIVAGEQLHITAGWLDNTKGSIFSLGTDDNSLTLNVSGIIDNTTGEIETRSHNFALTSYNIVNQGGQIRHLGEGTFSIHGDGGFTNDGGELATAGSMDVRLSGSFLNDGRLIAMNDLFINASDINNLASRLISAAHIRFAAESSHNKGRIQADTVRVDGNSFTNEGGELFVLGQSDNSLTLNVDQFTNIDNGRVEIHGGNNTLSTTVINRDGKIFNFGEGSLTFTGLNNSEGRVESQGAVEILQGAFENRLGVIQTAGNLVLAVDTLNNQGGTLQSASTLDIQARLVDNSEQGTLLSSEGFRLVALDSINNAGGIIESLASNIHIEAARFDNQAGMVLHRGNSSLDFSVGNFLNNTGGTIFTEGSLSLDVETILNNKLDEQRALISAGHLTITANELQNNGGNIQAAETLALTLPYLDNRNGFILSNGTADNALTLQVGSIDNRKGAFEIHSNNVSFENIAFDNREAGTINHLGAGSIAFGGTSGLMNAGGTVQSQGRISIRQQNLDNSGGQINAAAVDMLISAEFNNSTAGKVAAGKLSIQADSVNNNKGIVAGLGNSDDSLVLKVNNLDNSDGTLRNGADSWTLNLDSLINTGGSIFHTGNNQLTLTSDYLLTTSGTIASKANLSISAKGITNTGILAADENINITSSGAISNSDKGKIQSGADLTITGTEGLDNQGEIFSGNSLQITLDGVLNNSKTIIANGTQAAITANSLLNSGTISQNNAAGNFILSTATLSNAVGGQIKSEGLLTLNASDITNSAIISANRLNATGFNQLRNNQNGIIEAGTINFQGTHFTNAGTVNAVNTNDSLILNVTNTTNNTGGVIRSNSTNQSFLGNFTNAGSFVHAGTGVLRLGNAGTITLEGGQVSTAGTAELSGTFNGSGQVFAQTAINITGAGTFTNNGSSLYTKGNFTITSALNNQGGKLLSDGTMRIQTGGAVTNANSGSIQGAGLTISAGSLTNSATITSIGNAAGSISAGSIDNRRGTISTANQNFTLSSTNGNINNTDGLISHTGNGTLTINSSADLQNNAVQNNNAGKILTNGSLNATIAGLLSNSSGEITAGTFILRAADVNNSNGFINAISEQGGSSSQILAATLNNTKGSIGSNNQHLTIDLSTSLLNTDGTIQHAGSGVLLVKAPSITNNTQKSTIKTNGSLELATQGHFNNGGVLSAFNNLAIKALANNLTQVTNTHKITSSAGEVNIETSERITNSGTIEGKQKVGLKTGDLSNSGTIKSEQEVHLDMTRLSLTGTIQADELLSLNVKESVSVKQGETLSTQGSLILITQGDITNAGKIAAEKSLELGGINLTNSGQINGGSGTTKVHFSGDITNTGGISGDNALSIKARNYINNGSTAAANSLTMIATNNIENNTGNVIFSGGSMTLGAGGSINNTNDSTLFSIGNMVLEGATGAGSKSQAINNVNSRIEALGTLELGTQNLKNERTGVSYVAQTPVVDVGPPISITHSPGITVIETKTTTTTTYNPVAEGSDSVIASGGNMTINGGAISNFYGTISSGGSLHLSGTNLSHHAYTQKTTIQTSISRHIRNCPPGGSCTSSNGGTEHFEPYDVYANENVIGTIRAAGNITGNLSGQLQTTIDGGHQSGSDSQNTKATSDSAGAVSGGYENDVVGLRASVISTAGDILDVSGGSKGHGGQVNGGGFSSDGTFEIDLNDPDMLEFLAKQGIGLNDGYDEALLKDTVFIYDNGKIHTISKADLAAFASEGGFSGESAAATAKAISGSDFDALTALLNAQSNNADSPTGSSGQEIADVDGAISRPGSQNSNTGAIKDETLSDALFDFIRNLIGSTANAADKEVHGADIEAQLATPVDNVSAGASGNKNAAQKGINTSMPNPLVVDVTTGNPTIGNPGGLYVTNTSPNSNYLIETRPEFTQYSNFLGSDYLLRQLGYDPDKTLKRLGDAFYENQLIRDALSAQANTRYVSGASSDYAQMQMLMDNAAASSKSLQLTVGIALSAAQVAALTEDILWLVEKTVNGEKVLVPTLYLASVNKDNLTHKGATIAAGGSIDLHAAEGINLQGKNTASGSIKLSTDGDLVNKGALAAGSDIDLSAGSHLENFGQIQGSGNVVMKAGDTLTNHSSGSVVAGDTLKMTSVNDLINRQGYLEGNNVLLTSETGSIINRTEYQQTTTTNGNRTSTWTVVGASSTIVSHNNLVMDAGKDIDLQGSRFSASNDIALYAGNDILLNGIERKTETASTHNKTSTAYRNTTWDTVGLDAGNNLIMSAGRDISAQGAQLSAGNHASLTAGRDVNLEAVANENHSESIAKRKQTIDTSVTHTLASITSGGTTSIKAGQDINMIGATVDAGGNVLLHAERDTNLVSVNDSEYHYDYTKKKSSFGRSKTTINETLSETVTGGSINAGGSVLINAQGSDAGLIKLNSGNVNIIGGTINAGDHVVISADEDINIVASTYNELDFHSTKKSGFGGLSKKSAGTVEETTSLNRAGINAGGNISLLSGNDIALIAADITAGGDINMDAVDRLLIGAGEAVSQSASWSKSSGFFSGGDLYSMKETRAGEKITSGEGSALNAGGKITSHSGSATIIGSDLHGENGVQLVTDIGNIEILAAKTTSESYSYEKSMRVGLGDMLDSLTNPEDLVKSKDGRLTVKLADASYDEVDTKTNITTMTGSNITSGNGNVHLQSADSILIEGSNLEAGKNNPDAREGNVNLVAVNDVTIREATDTLDTETKEVHGTAELSLVVQNQAVEVVKAALAVDDAKDQLQQAQKDYKKYQRDLDNLGNTLASLESDYANKVPGVNYADILELRELVKDMEGDKDWYIAGVALAAANLTAKTTALVQQTAAAAQSTGTYGFNAGLQLDIDATKSNTTLKETTAVASTITGNNINIVTGKGKDTASGTTTTIQGSHLNADNHISINTGELNILASRDTRDMTNETEKGHITAQMTVYGASGGASVNADFSRSKNSETSTTINNSTLNADRITLVTTDDANIRGGNVHADNELIASIGGDLNVESLQDRHRTKNNSAGISGGVSTSGGSATGVNAGLNASNGMSVTRETVLSSLTSGGTASINVTGNTQITGALIATIDEAGNDLGQLSLNTGSLSFTDLTNTYQSNQTSGSISTSIGLGGKSGTDAAQDIPNAKDGQGRDMRLNTSNITYSNTSQYDADKSLATLGSGNINVGGVQLEIDGQLTDAGLADGSALERLNRDTTNLNKDLWSVERTEGNIDLQIDHRMFSEEGRKEIAEDFKRTEILGQSIADMTQDSVSFFGAGDGESSLREHIGNKQDYFTATKNFVNNKDNEAHVATLGNADATPAEKQAAYTALVNTIAAQMGVDPTQAKILLDADPDFAGAFSRDTNLIYLNDLAHGSAGEAVNTLGHETQHHIDNQRNPNASGSEQYSNNRENYAGIMGNATEDYLGFNFATGGYSLSGSNNNSLGTTKSDIGNNLGLVSGNYDSFSREDSDSLDFRLHIGQLKSFAAEMDGCSGDQCKTNVVDKYRAIANEQNGFTPNEQIVYDQAVSSITYQLMGDCNTAQCKEYIHNQMLLVSLECGSTDCIRERGMSVRNAANILARNWSDVALDATLDGLAVAGVVVPGALPGKQVVKDALSDGAETAARGSGQAERIGASEADSLSGQLTTSGGKPVHDADPYSPDVVSTRTIESREVYGYEDGGPFPGSFKRPEVDNEKLKNIVDQMYKGDRSPSGVLGSGSTADAAREEFKTGELFKGTNHLSNKAPQLINAIESWLSKNKNASAGDIHAAQEMLKDLKNAINGKLND